MLVLLCGIKFLRITNESRPSNRLQLSNRMNPPVSVVALA
jgi:hypothetical protein